jgi:DNA polymerase-3 subunit chi
VGAARFYHVLHATPEDILRQLIERARAEGHRVVVRGATEGWLEALDARLWTDPEDGFLPHGRAGGPHDALQPVLLTLGRELPQQPGSLLVAEGAATDPAEAAAVERLCIVFDGRDPAAVETARAQWRAMTGAGVAAEYWSNEGGRWALKQKR